MTKHAQKRSPLKRRPLRNPGEGLLHDSYDVAIDTVIPWFMATVGLAVLAAAEWMRWYFKAPPNPLLFTLLFVIVLVIALFRIPRALKELDAILLGAKGEKAVGHFLERFRNEGYEVYHDVPEDRGNVDHVLIGPGGVFVIETKTISKAVGRDAKISYDGERILVDGLAPDRDPVAQVRACASGIRSILENGVGFRPKVRPVVLYPGWWIERQPKGVEVWVLTPEALTAFVRHEDDVYRDDQVKLLAAALDNYVRTYAPSLAVK